MPNLDFESQEHRQGRALVAGIDEVGRGSLAGPVMAGAVVLSPDLQSNASWLKGIDDSKKLTPIQREVASSKIRVHALCTGIGLANSREVDTLGIVNATRTAMLRAIRALPITPDHLLIDFMQLESAHLPFTSIPKGDSQSYSIAAASIIAKVARDHLMIIANSDHPGYDFHLHKGYGTRHHLVALKLRGPSPIHRFSFAPVQTSLRRLQYETPTNDHS